MIYLDNLESFLNKHPYFKEMLPICKCNTLIRPFISKKSIGLQCSKCESSVWVRKPEHSLDYLFLGE